MRVIDVIKKMPALAQLKQAFELSITKMKRPDRLERTDLVQGEVPVQLQVEFEEIRLKNEEITDPELWNTESLCFRYFNILHLYKTNKQVWIDWLRIIKKGPVSDSELVKIEQRVGLNVSAAK